MARLLTAAQMRVIETEAIASGRVSGAELMERAGRGVVEAVLAEWPDLATTSHRAVVLCGPGNNGGDGFVVARLLKARGWEVEVFLLGDPDRLPPDAGLNHARWSALGDVRPLAEAQGRSHGADLHVDALFGTGLTRPLEGAALDWARDRARDRASEPETAARTVAIDIPSGLCSDSGRMLAQDTQTIIADLTVTFHTLKPGHVLDQGPPRCAKVMVTDIGLGAVAPGGLHLVTGPMQALAKTPLGHKYDHGHALVLCGPPSHGGAARLAARAALRVGAGLVTLVCPAAAQAENAARLDAIMLHPVVGIDEVVERLADPRITAICLGPGLGTGNATLAQVTAVLGADRATVLDADALSAFADAPQSLFDQVHDLCVLTPHAGEFARLFPDIAEALRAAPDGGPAMSKVDATSQAAMRAGCTVLFKGADTVIASPDGRAAIHCAQYERAAPWLATAGSGDVLAGLIAGLLARGLDPHEAACSAAWLHVEAARCFGPGLIAEDLPEELPAVFRALGRQVASIAPSQPRRSFRAAGP